MTSSNAIIQTLTPPPPPAFQITVAGAYPRAQRRIASAAAALLVALAIASSAIAPRIAQAQSSDATLSSLTLSGITLTPTFSPAMQTYTASVENSVSISTLAFETTDDQTTVAVALSGMATRASLTMVNLGVGTNIIRLTVTAEDNTTMLTYTVTVTRAMPGAPELTIAKVADVTEGTGVTLDFTITPSSAFAAETEITVTVDASVYILEVNRTQTATFTAGSTAAQTVSFPLRDDDGDETGGAVVTATITPNAAFTVAGPAQATITDAGEGAPGFIPGLRLKLRVFLESALP